MLADLSGVVGSNARLSTPYGEYRYIQAGSRLGQIIEARTGSVKRSVMLSSEHGQVGRNMFPAGLDPLRGYLARGERYFILVNLMFPSSDGMMLEVSVPTCVCTRKTMT